MPNLKKKSEPVTQKVIAIIITYNPDLEKLLLNLIALNDQIDRCVIVDNTPITNHTLEIGSSFNFAIETVYLQENKGIAFAQNIGIKIAENHLASHIFFLDQDSIAGKNCVALLLTSIERANVNGINIAACCALPHDKNYPAGYPIIIEDTGWPKRVIPRQSVDVEVMHSISSGSLVPVNAIEQIGYMHEELFIDYVDIEWCLRARSLGFSIVVNTSASLSHCLGKDAPPKKRYRYIPIYDATRVYYQVRNSIKLARMKHVPIKWAIWHLPKALIIKPVIYLIRGPLRRKIALAILKGFYEGLCK